MLTGTIEPGMELVNARTRKGERLTHLYVMCGREMTESATPTRATSSWCPAER